MNEEELQYMEQACELARALYRPFTEREVLGMARSEGYELHLASDPRFIRIAGRQGNTPPLWIIDEDPARLLRVRLSDFFCGLYSYAQRCIGQARVEALPILAHQQAYIHDNGKKKLPDEIVAELLMKQGWTL